MISPDPISSGTLTPGFSPVPHAPSKAKTVSTVSTPLDEARAAKIITDLYDDAKSATKRIVALGLFCIGFKAQLNHGEFQDWLETNCPGIPYRTLADYMQITKGVFELHGVKAIDFAAEFPKVRTSHISHPGEFLLAETAQVPEHLQPLHTAIAADLSGQSRRQLTFKLKSTNMLGGFHPPSDDVLLWLRANQPALMKSYSSDASGLSPYPWLLAHHPDIAAAYKKQFRAKPIPADLALQAKRDRFQRLLDTAAASLDQREFAHMPADLRRTALHLFRDYYKALSASLKGSKKAAVRTGKRNA